MTSSATATQGLLAAQPPRWMTWVGRVLTVLPAAVLLLSAVMKLSGQAQMHDDMTHKLGYSETAVMAIGVIELVSTVLFVIPRTSLFGALLLTAHLGGAVATHVRVGESFAMPIVVGILVWAAMLVREPSLRALLSPATPKNW